ncbi:hypothetical protein [Flavobacterium aciduliphilum]|uniref:Uncharacterized protein n=1 Tax=Flavobacterium aciduliphilum TaxID=1101402 RepID=A0A328YI34_9FLAO|nr:hypothetical protein [Flavobacterium aciduliphilum]RAR73758.1 hypothetical protein CLV55_10377 [Flavobacterium aciduliphilum]
MTIQFQHPSNGFINFNPSDVNHYSNLNLPGVYIYGLRLEFIINRKLERKFVPMAVGETDNLKRRLFFEHYSLLSTNGNSSKEIFNWASIRSLNDLMEVYTDMSNYKQSKTAHNSTLKNLIWYNDSVFFDNKLNLSLYKSKYISGTGVLKSIGQNGDLDSIFLNNIRLYEALKMKTDIILTKEIFVNNFYFIYATDGNIIKRDNFSFNVSSNRLSVEKTSKQLLTNINIFTTADSRRGSIIPLSLDLSCIQNDLINLTGKPFINPLIL